METLKYSYGETPEAVIREQLADVESPRLGGNRTDYPLRTPRGKMIAVWGSDVDTLITVLDALKLATEHHEGIADAMADCVDELGHYRYADEFPDHAAKLRIDILAALGIVEG